MGTAGAWTPERRAKQAETIRRNRPWDKSTGPRTAAGKAVSSRNADKGGHREELRALDRWSRARLRFIEHLIARDGIKPYGLANQVGRQRRRSAAAQARYDAKLERLYREMVRLGDLPFPLPELELLNNSPTETERPFPDGEWQW